LLTSNGFVYFSDIEIIGPDGITIIPQKESLLTCIDSVFEKNVLAFSKNGMQKISQTIVAVIGTGGIGSGLLYQMARIGFKYVNLIDPDTIIADNCNRLYGVSSPDEAVGKIKVKFMAQVYRLFNPKARVWYVAGDARLNKAKRLLKRADLIILSVDNDSIRAIINSFAAQYTKPLINVSSGIYMDKEGLKIKDAGTQIQWFIPREKEYPCLRCQGGLHQKEVQSELMDDTQKENRKRAGYIANTQISPEPQVMPLNGIGISMAMWQICCWITGSQKPAPWTYYDAVENKLINIQVKQNPECTCCGLDEMSILGLGDCKQTLNIRK
jgi:molybdopterin/thiamine biosynthesis adenylyltransferase